VSNRGDEGNGGTARGGNAVCRSSSSGNATMPTTWPAVSRLFSVSMGCVFSPGGRLLASRPVFRILASPGTHPFPRHVFRYPFAEVAEIVGRTPAACRQLASAARRRGHGVPAGVCRFATYPSQLRSVLRFVSIDEPPPGMQPVALMVVM
jgi:hypothetical protein